MSNISLMNNSSTAPAVSIESMKIGARGSFVEQLQKTLTSEGYNSSSNIDGIFGPKTLKAVQDYQMSNSISNPRGNFYGVAGPRTLGSLGLATESPNPVAAAANVSASAPTETAVPKENGIMGSIIDTAKKYIGSPYLWGGTSPSGFDCSGFIQHAFAQNGKELPRTVAQMWEAGEKVSTPSKGDLVFFETRTGPSHAGIYLGNNKFLHSGASTGVTITDMDNSYWKSRYLGAKAV